MKKLSSIISILSLFFWQTNVLANSKDEPIGDKNVYVSEGEFQTCLELANAPWPEAIRSEDRWDAAWNDIDEKLKEFKEDHAKNLQTQIQYFESQLQNPEMEVKEDESKYFIAKKPAPGEAQDFSNVDMSSFQMTAEQEQEIFDQCKARVEEYSNVADFASTAEGVEIFKECQGSKTGILQNNFAQQKYAQEQELQQATSSENSIEKNTLEQLGDTASSIYSVAKSMAEQLHRCEAYISATRSADFDSKYNARNSKTSSDGRITCTSAGVITRDYPGCENLIMAYNGALVAQVGMQSYQQVDFVDHTVEAQASVNANDATSGIEAQKGAIEKQADYANQRAALDGAKTGAIMAAMNSMPTREDIENQCLADKSANIHDLIDQKYQEIAEQIADALPNTLPFIQYSLTESESKIDADIRNIINAKRTGGNSGNVSVTEIEISSDLLLVDTKEKTHEEMCGYVVNNEPRFIVNGAARDMAKQIMIESGVMMASNLAKAALLNDQAGKIDDALKDIKKFDPLQVDTQMVDAVVDECTENPELEICGPGGQARSVGFQGSDLNIGGLGSSNSSVGPGALPTSRGSGASGTTASSDRASVPTTVGSIVTDPARDNSFASRSSGAASVKTKEGGAGGGGGISIGSGGGGGGGLNTAGRSRGALRGKKASKVGYSKGNLRFGGGLKRGKARKPASNPLKGLLGGNKKSKNKNDVMEFNRRLASTKNKASIFKMVSDRYGIVKKQNRLLEYIPKE